MVGIDPAPPDMASMLSLFFGRLADPTMVTSILNHPTQNPTQIAPSPQTSSPIGTSVMDHGNALTVPLAHAPQRPNPNSAVIHLE